VAKKSKTENGDDEPEKEPEKETSTPQQLDAFLDKMEKKYEGRIVRGKDIEQNDAGRKCISTGSTKLDWAMTLPLVEGTINEIHAKNGVGKTTLALEIAANATLMGKPVFFFDLERKLVESQISMIPRLRRDLFVRIRPDNGEDAVNRVEACVKDVPGCVIIFDSLTQMLPEVEETEKADNQRMGLIAKLAAKMVRKIVGPTERNRCMVLFLSHETANMDPYSGGIKTKGGNAVPDISAQRIHMKKLSAGKIVDGDGNIIGHKVKCKVVKNNQGLPFREVEVPIIYGRGIDRTLDLYQVCVDLGVIDKNGAWHTIEIDGKSQKCYKPAVLQHIRDDKPYRDSLRKSVGSFL
jgi:recombination protein RecA